MTADCQVPDSAARPVFFYHLGDVIYYTGLGSEYYNQFYEPYQQYPLPIFAIPGNHDGEVDDTTQQSLAAFVTNFLREKRLTAKPTVCYVLRIDDFMCYSYFSPGIWCP